MYFVNHFAKVRNQNICLYSASYYNCVELTERESEREGETNPLQILTILMYYLSLSPDG